MNEQPWYPVPAQPELSYHERGMRAPFESVWRDGRDLTDTVRPADWPEPHRSNFFDLGWRPFIPTGVTPAWLQDAGDRTEPTPSPLMLQRELERQQRERRRSMPATDPT